MNLGNKKSDFDVISKSSFKNSIYSGSKFGVSANKTNVNIKKIDIKPSIQEQMDITKDWWYQFNKEKDLYMPSLKVKKFFVEKGLTLDMNSAEAIVVKALGKVNRIKYEDFYRIFCKGIFRVALQDMMSNINEMS